jgi:hypothetical protein
MPPNHSFANLSRIRLWLPDYVTPSLNSMLGRNHWILTKMKKEARHALQAALKLQSSATASRSSTSTTALAAAQR